MAKKKINQVLYDLVKAKGTNESVSKPLGVTPQALGRYMKDRMPPVAFILKWKEVYKEDLLALSELDNEPNVSRETLQKEFDKEVGSNLTMEMFKQVQKDSDGKDEFIRNLWKLIEAGGVLDALKRITANNP